MIRGWFDEFGRPYVRARVVIPRLRVDHDVYFLADTGASNTCLHPSDAVDIGIPFRRLRNPRNSRGVGGASPYFREPAYLLFTDGDLTRIYSVELLIAEPSESNLRLPSLLGRNIMNNWRSVFDPAIGVLEFAPRRADRTIGR